MKERPEADDGMSVKHLDASETARGDDESWQAT